MLRLFYFSMLFFLLIACNKEAQFIETIRSGENPYLLQVDTLTASYSIFRDDSVLTSSDEYALIGNYSDTATGSVNAAHFAQFNKPEQLPEMDRTARFDSLVLLMYSDTLYYGDTSTILQLSVNRLTENIRSENSQFYNTSAFTYAPSPIGEYSGVFRPASGDSIRIMLDQTFGNELFNLIQTKSDIVSNQDRFENWVKGFTIRATGTTNVVYKFKKNLVLRLYYSEDDAIRKAKSIDLNPTGTPFQFNQFKQDFSGTAFEGLDTANEVVLPATQHYFFLQSFSNIRCYAKFNGLKDIKKIAGFVQLLNGELEVKPVIGSYLPGTLPSQIHLYVRDVNNAITGPLAGVDNSIQTGSLFIDTDFGRNTRYTYDITSYIEYELESTNVNSRRLVIQIGDDENLMKNVLINRTRLILSMLVYQQNN